MAESQVNFTNEVLLSLAVPVPPIQVQRRIAEVIGLVDELIRHSEGAIAKCERVRKAVINDLYGRELLGLGARAHWTVTTVDSLTSQIVDGVHFTPRYQRSGVPFVTVENLTRSEGISFEVSRYISAGDHREFSKRVRPKPGDVLVTKDGTLGVARTVPEDAPDFSIFVSVALLRPKSNLVTAQFLRGFFDTDAFARQLSTHSSGTGLKHIHLEQFKALRIAIPPIQVQRKIAATISQHDEMISIERRRLRNLRMMKRGLIEDLLKGGSR